jgi:outer membrane protein TolC
MTEAEAVAEFREASAAVRRAFGARDDARVDQILADTRMSSATVNLSDAQARLLAADVALQAARAEPPTPADIDVTRPASVVEANLPGKGLWYRVRMGRFPSKEAATHYLADFKRETAISGIVTTAN